MTTSTLRYGIDQPDILRKRAGRGRWGMVTNDAATTAGLVPGRQAAREAGIHIATLFAPEHGLDAAGADGAAMPDRRDALTGLPVVSLYGNRLQPEDANLASLDGLLFDLPDAGVRFYTYIWTLSYAMEACAAAGKTLVVLDRPNPLGGDLALAEGPLLEESAQASFIGRWAMPIRHCLTVGELACYWQHSRGLPLDLQVVKIKGWRRRQWFGQLGLPFVPPSPALSSAETLLTYPALCYMEGMNLSEGRGTAYPFRICGAPWVDGHALATAFNRRELPGVKARPVSFQPEAGRYAGVSCQGIMLHVTDTATYRPVATGFALCALLWLLFPEKVQWAPYPTRVNPSGAGHFDRLAGTARVRMQLEADPAGVFDHPDQFTGCDGWENAVSPWLLYP